MMPKNEQDDRQNGWARLEARARQLVKLLDLSAPPIVIIRQAELVANAAEWADPEMTFQIRKERAEQQRLQGMGLCGRHYEDLLPVQGSNVLSQVCQSCVDEVDAADAENMKPQEA